jgi:hypothetical protein
MADPVHLSEGRLTSRNGEVRIGDLRAAEFEVFEVDFGGPGEDSVIEIYVDAPWAGTRAIAHPLSEATADHEPSDVAIEGLVARVYDLVPGVGFSVIVNAPNGTWGRYLMEAG